MNKDIARVYVQGMMLGIQTKAVFLKQGPYKLVQRIEDSDIVVWTGGEDIYPGIYGEKPITHEYWGRERDKSDLKAIELAIQKDKFLVGICRGAQLLNCVPNGGKLWQDVDNHGGCVHLIHDGPSGKTYKVNSVHHQAMKITTEAELIAWTNISHEKESEGVLWRRPPGIALPGAPEEFDVEACWYPKTKSLCVQFHPEFGHKETTDYFFELMDKYFFKKTAQEEAA